MEDLATDVTPAMDSTPAADPLVQQLLAENARLQQRLEQSEQRRAALERRLTLYKEVYDRISAIVKETSGAKGAEG